MYKNIYRGMPWDKGNTEIAEGFNEFTSEKEALESVATLQGGIWKPCHIGVMKVNPIKKQGFINIYPSTEFGVQGLSYNEASGVDLRTGTGMFPTRERADRFALPSRISVATFEYEE